MIKKIKTLLTGHHWLINFNTDKYLQNYILNPNPLHVKIFLFSFCASCALLASGFFIGHLGVDDELLMRLSYFDGIGRGLWLNQLITYLLPGQMGISFAPMFIGCILYSTSISILIIGLWKLQDVYTACASAAIMGCFPYFASMMSFDVVQVAYPLGFIFITISLLSVFYKFSITAVFLSSCFFAMGFACYQGVATTYVTAFVSTVGIRFVASSNKNVVFKQIWLQWFPKMVLIALLGSVFYFGSTKISQLIVPHNDWSGLYKVSLDLRLVLNKIHLQNAVNNSYGLWMGHHGDLPRLAAKMFFLGNCILTISLVLMKGFELWKKIILILALWFSIAVAPFWLLLVQANLLTPRSTVGLGILYGFCFAALSALKIRNIKTLMFISGIILCLQFIFIGNQMYYSQYIKTLSDYSLLNRIIARVDAITCSRQQMHPISLAFIGGHDRFAINEKRFNTLGASPLGWGGGDPGRQAGFVDIVGIEGINIVRDPKLLNEINSYAVLNSIPEWPHPASIFEYKDRTVCVFFHSLSLQR
jgi:hypothetical protein